MVRVVPSLGLSRYPLGQLATPINATTLLNLAIPMNATFLKFEVSISNGGEGRTEKGVLCCVMFSFGRAGLGWAGRSE